MLRTLLFFFFCPAVGLAAQATLTPLTTMARAHLDAKINSQGSHVAFRVGRTNLGVVPIAGGAETTIHTSAAGLITSFVWDTGGTVIYFADGNSVLAVARTGGTATTLNGSIAGSNVTIWCTDGTWIYGTRQDQTNGLGYVFRLRTNGGLASDIVTMQGVLDEVSLDASQRYLLMRNWSGAPFTPTTFHWYDTATGTAASQIGVTNDPASSSAWLDNGANIVFAVRSPTFAAQQVSVMDLSGAQLFYTELTQVHRRTVMIPGASWIACETVSATGGGITIGLIPRQGGGVVYLDAGRALYLNGGVTTGGLSMDLAQSKLVLSAGTTPSDPNPQIWSVDLVREIEVRPRVAIGQSFQIRMPLNSGDIGGVVVSLGLAPAPVSLPPFTGQVYIDLSPGMSLGVLSGVGLGGPLVGSWTLPMNPGLVGIVLWFQGVRLDGSLQGGFTRFGRYQVF
jgi:hypothetical protein